LVSNHTINVRIQPPGENASGGFYKLNRRGKMHPVVSTSSTAGGRKMHPVVSINSTAGGKMHPVISINSTAGGRKMYTVVEQVNCSHATKAVETTIKNKKQKTRSN
jgi:hypothetical protein